MIINWNIHRRLTLLQVFRLFQLSAPVTVMYLSLVRWTKTLSTIRATESLEKRKMEGGDNLTAPFSLLHDLLQGVAAVNVVFDPSEHQRDSRLQRARRKSNLCIFCLQSNIIPPQLVNHSSLNARMSGEAGVSNVSYFWTQNKGRNEPKTQE